MEDKKQRSDEVERLLHNCVNEKLCSGRTVQAREYAEQAYDLATKPEKLDSYLPHLAAYRLAHLILRSNNPSEDELYRAEELLSYASRVDNALGPMPSLFRVAVLIRLKTLSFGNAKLDQKIKAAFERARDGVLKLQHREPNEKERRVVLQGILLNLLEMAAYTAGLTYSDKLEGLKDPWGDLHLSSSSWFLLGKTRSSRYRYPKEYALAELDPLGEKHPDAILFRLCEHPQWKRADSNEWKQAGEKRLRLIAGALAGEGQEKLKNHVTGEFSPEAFRQVRKNTREDLRRMLGRGTDYDPLPDSPDGGVTVADDLLIFGAVNDATFRKVPERND